MTNRQITAADRENAQRLRAIWNAKKKQLELNQVKAAAKLGFRYQSTVSQYLNCNIALNTDVILKFAQLLEVDPARIDPSIASVVERSLESGSDQIDVVCRVVMNDLGSNCVKETPSQKQRANPFPNDIPKGTRLIGVEIGTNAYQSAFGIPGSSLVYVLQDAEPRINDVVYVELKPETEAERPVAFYRFNGLMQNELLLTDALTAKTERILLENVERIGVQVGYIANDLERRAEWAI